MHLTVAFVNITYFFTVRKLESGAYEGTGGVEFTLLRILSQVLNFTYELIQPSDNAWGMLKEDGTWSGMVGLLHRKEADMAIDYITLSKGRAQATDYTFPYNIDYSTFVIKKSGMVRTTFYFAHPFQLPVWVCIVVFLLLSAVVLTLLQRLKWPCMRKTDRLNIKIIFTTAETLIGNHDFGHLFRNCASRLFFAVSALSFRILMFSFTGLLLSFLMTPIMEHQIKTVAELVEASRTDRVKVNVLKDSNTAFTFKEINEETTKGLSKYIRNNPNGLAVSIPAGVTSLMDGYAFMEAKTLIAALVYEKGWNDKFFISNDAFQLMPKVILFKKNFCCVKEFDIVILRLHESGIYHKLLRDLFYKLDVKAKFQATPESPVKHIGIENLLGVVGLLFCGCALAMGVFICELWNKNPKRKRKPKNKHSLRLHRRNV